MAHRPGLDGLSGLTSRTCSRVEVNELGSLEVWLKHLRGSLWNGAPTHVDVLRHARPLVPELVRDITGGEQS